jgi:DNA-binding transcriptional ArsR family regulator
MANKTRKKAGRSRKGGANSTDFRKIQRAVGAISRLAALYEIGNDERDATSIADALKFSPSLLSNHLKVLLDAGLVQRRKAGSNRFYSLAKATSFTRKGSGTELKVRATDGSWCASYIPDAALSKRVLN